MADSPGLTDSARLVLADGVSLLHPAEQVTTAMLAGWRDQGLAWNLAISAVDARARQIKSFAAHADLYPWQWTTQVADEYFADLRSVHGCTRSTVRGYQVAIRGFCAYLTEPAYGWAAECENRFGTHPVQVINEVNAAVHVADVESEPTKRAFTRGELQELFDHADERVYRKRAFGRKGHLAAFRDATLLKVAYSFGLRRAETRMLDVTDFGRNPAATEFGDFGMVHVRYGKAQRGSPPKRRSVLTVWP